MAVSCKRQITHGKQTDLLIDPWIEGKSLVDMLGWDTYLARSCPNTKLNLIYKGEAGSVEISRVFHNNEVR